MSPPEENGRKTRSRGKGNKEDDGKVPSGKTAGNAGKRSKPDSSGTNNRTGPNKRQKGTAQTTTTTRTGTHTTSTQTPPMSKVSNPPNSRATARRKAPVINETSPAPYEDQLNLPASPPASSTNTNQNNNNDNQAGSEEDADGDLEEFEDDEPPYPQHQPDEYSDHDENPEPTSDVPDEDEGDTSSKHREKNQRKGGGGPRDKEFGIWKDRTNNNTDRNRTGINPRKNASAGSAEESDSDDGGSIPQDLTTQSVNIGHPKAAHYASPGDGNRSLSMKKQPPTLHPIIKDTIVGIKGEALFEDAYIDKSKGEDYIRGEFGKNALEKGEHAYANRAEKDVDFSHQITDLVIQQVSAYRSSIKKAVFPKIRYTYKLTPGAQAQGCMEKLLQDTTYIFPGAENESIDENKPYHHDAIVSTIREQFFTSSRKSLADQYAGRFKSSIDNGVAAEELELPAPIVALVTTAVHASLDEWAPGNLSARRAEFHVDAYEDVYKGHMLFLTGLEQDTPLVYHQLMADLYKLASNSVSASAEKINSNVRRLCNIAGMAT